MAQIKPSDLVRQIYNAMHSLLGLLLKWLLEPMACTIFNIIAVEQTSIYIDGRNYVIIVHRVIDRGGTDTICPLIWPCPPC